MAFKLVTPSLKAVKEWWFPVPVLDPLDITPDVYVVELTLILEMTPKFPPSSVGFTTIEAESVLLSPTLSVPNAPNAGEVMSTYECGGKQWKKLG